MAVLLGCTWMMGTKSWMIPLLGDVALHFPISWEAVNSRDFQRSAVASGKASDAESFRLPF